MGDDTIKYRVYWRQPQSDGVQVEYEGYILA